MRRKLRGAVNAAREAGCTELALLHCVSGYPAAPADYNLRTVRDLANKHDTLVGLSDHTLSNVTALTIIALEPR